MNKPKIGWIGAGLMGHGAAKNILEKGYPLSVMGNRNRQPIDDLVKRGAKELKTAAEMAKASDILFLCLVTFITAGDPDYKTSLKIDYLAQGRVPM